MGKAPFKFLKGEVKVSFKPAGSQLPLAQNNPHVKVAKMGRPVLDPFAHTLEASM